MRRAVIAALWLSATAGSSIYLATSLRGGDRTLYLPGDTTSGHHQIEDKCEICHEPGSGLREEACTGCHAEELAAADDSHPPQKFLDPRNAALLHRIDARRCVTCHVEHRPGLTGEMGVTQPADFCRTCHQDIAEERPSHRGLPFSGCQAAGCHNYHDNRALRETFLSERLSEPTLRPRATVPQVDREVRYRGLRKAPLGRGQEDAPPGASSEESIAAWAASSHARAGVNCTDCHGGSPVAAAGDAAARPWTDRPGQEGCRGCHGDEVRDFGRGKHGMREAAGLDPMSPDRARLAMNPAADHRELSCTSCHGAHDFDTRRAAVEACLGCHADRHSLAYIGSPHHERWQLEQSGRFWAGSGVSCATCHMPRVRRVDTDRPGVAVLHNQNDALRPVETMVRPVCLPCHGVELSLAALADRALVDRNFRGKPTARAEAIEMLRRLEAAEEEAR